MGSDRIGSSRVASNRMTLMMIWEEPLRFGFCLHQSDDDLKGANNFQFDWTGFTFALPPPFARSLAGRRNEFNGTNKQPSWSGSAGSLSSLGRKQHIISPLRRRPGSLLLGARLL